MEDFDSKLQKAWTVHKRVELGAVEYADMHLGRNVRLPDDWVRVGTSFATARFLVLVRTCTIH